MSKPIIEIENISKRYQIGSKEPYYTLRDMFSGALKFKKKAKSKKDFWALKDIDFTINQGDLVGIIGRNGSGKSTLLKVLSQITPPTKGKVTMRGRVASLLEVGTGFHLELTGRENIFLNGAILGMSQKEIKRNFDKIVDFSEIGKFIDTPVKRYSSGMYVRLAFAVAAHLEPEILIVDEVLAVGDAEFQKKCLGKMESIGKDGRTVLFVSHNMPSVQNLCQKGICLDHGQIMFKGEIKEVVKNYTEKLVDQGSLSAQNRSNGVLDIEKVFLKNSQDKKTTHFEPGESLAVEIHYNAKKKLEKPAFWVTVNSPLGPAFIANMYYDNFYPEVLKGKGKIICQFNQLPLLPGFYSLSLGLRDKGLGERILPNMDIGFFNVTGEMVDTGVKSRLADYTPADSAKIVIPHKWTLDDGSENNFHVKGS